MRNNGFRLLVLMILNISLVQACSSPGGEASPTTPPHQTAVTQTKSGTPSGSLTPLPVVEPADIIFHNGVIITIESSQPTAQALAVRGNIIQAVGSESEVLAYQGPETVMIDLQGQALMPGFEDGHLHYTRNKWGDGAPIPGLMADMASFGLTSITEMHSTDEYINAMLQAEANGEIDVRVNIFGEYNCGFLENGKSIECPSWYLDNDPLLDPTHLVRIPGVKIFVDGAGGNRGCPYNTFEWPDDIETYWPGIWETCTYPYGDLYLTEDELTAVLTDLQERGYRAAFHVMGDAGLDVTLNAIERALDGRSNLEVRHQIQHSSELRPDQLDRYAELNILAQVPGYFNTCEADILEAMFPGDVETWNVNRFALPGLGVHTYYGSDANGRRDIHEIGVGLDPRWSVYGFVTHQQFRDDMSVCTPPQWIAKYNYSIQQALEMMTIEPAYAVSMEEYIGSLKPGKYADLIILSDNPLTMAPDDLYQLNVWMTMMNGVQRYCAPGREAFCPASAQTAPPLRLKQWKQPFKPFRLNIIVIQAPRFPPISTARTSC